MDKIIYKGVMDEVVDLNQYFLEKSLKPDDFTNPVIITNWVDGLPDSVQFKAKLKKNFGLALSIVSTLGILVAAYTFREEDLLASIIKLATMLTTEVATIALSQAKEEVTENYINNLIAKIEKEYAKLENKLQKATDHDERKEIEKTLKQLTRSIAILNRMLKENTFNSGDSSRKKRINALLERQELYTNWKNGNFSTFQLEVTDLYFLELTEKDIQFIGKKNANAENVRNILTTIAAKDGANPKFGTLLTFLSDKTLCSLFVYHDKEYLYCPQTKFIYQWDLITGVFNTQPVLFVELLEISKTVCDDINLSNYKTMLIESANDDVITESVLIPLVKLGWWAIRGTMAVYKVKKTVSLGNQKKAIKKYEKDNDVKYPFSSFEKKQFNVSGDDLKLVINPFTKYVSRTIKDPSCVIMFFDQEKKVAIRVSYKDIYSSIVIELVSDECKKHHDYYITAVQTHFGISSVLCEEFVTQWTK